MPPPISNFIFLTPHDAQLVQLGVKAEQYFRDDPGTAIIKLRQFAELISKITAARSAVLDERDSFDDTLRRLSYDGIIPRTVADIFHTLRKLGNAAAHEHKGGHAEALTALKLARDLGVWFHRAYGKKPDFKPGPFIPPPEPADATAPLKEEIEALKRRVAESEDAATRARQEAEGHARARESAEGRLRREAEERVVWQQLAEQVEAEKADIAARLAAMNLAAIQDARRRSEALSAALAVKVGDAARLEAIQAAAAQAPGPEMLDLIQRGDQAAREIELDEAETRAIIDARLSDAGWEADTKALRHGNGARPVKGRNLAIAEWPTAHGPADYALFAGLTLVGVVEAKRRHKDVSAVIDQAERYSCGVAAGPDFAFADGGPWTGGQWGAFKVPFVFSTNGRPYLKQVETKSGIWTRDVRRPANLRHATVGWPKPEDLLGQLEIDVDAATAALKTMTFNFGFPLRYYQQAAIEAVETALESGKREMLLAMATGTGKTKLAIALLYRLLEAKRFRRICFVVDRSALGDQAGDEFTTTRIVSGKAFADIFGLKRLEDRTPENETKVHICTIQGLVKRVLFSDRDADTPSVNQYDLLVIDECHRGYLLDREMSDADMTFRSEDDYISKYRRVLDYFDAVKIGLTATPALHTVEIFNDPIFTYSYRQAVIDGFLIDHEPPVRIVTALARSGIGFAEGEQVEYIASDTSKISTVRLPDEIHFEVEQFNKQVVTTEFNRVVAEELAEHIFPYGDAGKTLVFAVNNDHADIVVDEIKKAFAKKYGEIDDAAVRKITGSVDKPRKAILAFKNDADPRIVVTVDLLTTGVNVPSITNLVFLRRVNSRILYEQMIGRATRLCLDINKEFFRIFDAVDLYPHLQNLTAMKPVVVNPSVTFEQLVKELIAATHDDHRGLVRDQLAVKLRRRLKKLTKEAKEHYEATAGEAPEATLKRLLEDAPAALSAWFSSRAAIGKILDEPDGGSPRFLPISHHPDSLAEVAHGYADGVSRPEDFLDGFTRWVKDNVNTIAALTVVTQRPRDLTRSDLKALRTALDQNGYRESYLHHAWAAAKNVDIAASIIGYVRQAALGDPLVPYSDRVKAAMQRILASRTWTGPQKQWLTRIGRQIEKEIVVDREALDQDPFAKDGGFRLINRAFGGELETVLNRINGEIWEKTG